MAISLDPCLQDSFGVVDAARESLKTKKHFSGSCGAVNEWRSQALQASEMVAMDVAEEAGERRSQVWVRPKEVNYVAVY